MDTADDIRLRVQAIILSWRLRKLALLEELAETERRLFLSLIEADEELDAALAMAVALGISEESPTLVDVPVEQIRRRRNPVNAHQLLREKPDVPRTKLRGNAVCRAEVFAALQRGPATCAKVSRLARVEYRVARDMLRNMALEGQVRKVGKLFVAVELRAAEIIALTPHTNGNGTEGLV